MKKQILLLMLVLGGWQLSAQESIQVEMGVRPSSQGVKPAFEVAVPQATAADAMDLWEKTLAPRGLFGVFRRSPKLQKEKDEWVMREVVVEKISSEPMDVFAQVTTFPDRIYVRAFFRQAGGFIGEEFSGESDLRAASEFVRNYAVDLYRLAVQKELDNEEDKLKDLERDLSRMDRRKGRFERQIKSSEGDISELQRNVREREMQIKRREEMKTTASFEGQDASAYESELKSLQKELRSDQRSLRRANRSVSQNERRVRSNLKDQADAKNEIDKQRIRVREVKTKLDNIR